MNRFFVAWALSLLLVAPGARAGLMINVGDHELLPNTPAQQFAIPVTGGDLVQGLNLLLQVGDGGPALGGLLNSGPKITDISITTGTIFDGNNTGRVFDDPATDQFWQIHTTTSSGTISASGILALITVDTTGFTTGSFPLLLGDIDGDPYIDTDFAGVPATIINGAINVPEPETLLAFLFTVIAAGRRRG